MRALDCASGLRLTCFPPLDLPNESLRAQLIEAAVINNAALPADKLRPDTTRGHSADPSGGPAHERAWQGSPTEVAMLKWMTANKVCTCIALSSHARTSDFYLDDGLATVRCRMVCCVLAPGNGSAQCAGG
jgi:hypothetical protein